MKQVQAGHPRHSRNRRLNISTRIAEPVAKTARETVFAEIPDLDTW
jgi:hypothetical protein